MFDVVKCLYLFLIWHILEGRLGQNQADFLHIFFEEWKVEKSLMRFSDLYQLIIITLKCSSLIIFQYISLLKVYPNFVTFNKWIERKTNDFFFYFAKGDQS